METTIYNTWRPKNILIIVVITMLINLILFMALPALTRMADRGWGGKIKTDYIIETHEAPKPKEDSRERRLRSKELKQIPKPKVVSTTQPKMNTPKFVFDTNATSTDGFAVAVPTTDRMDIGIDDLTFSIGDVDSPPRVIRSPPVNPPYDAVSKGITGKVFVKVRVGVDGKATNIKALRAEPPEALEIFGETAEKGVARYRFEPARLGGEAVPVWAIQPINFELE